MNTERKIELIEKNLQEIINKDIMLKIVAARPLRIYWGTAITGKPHIGYFLPILKIRDFINAGCEMKILLADIHGFLDNLKAPIEKVNQRVKYYEKLLKTMLKSLGIDIEKIRFVLGSSYQLSKEYTFDLYRLSSYTTVHDTMRAGSQVVKQSENPLLSSLIYPNMQALDEKYLEVDAQFGGIDQRKIFMHSGKYTGKVGYKKCVYLMNPMMEGLNSDKMCSSDDSGKIDFLDSSSALKKKIRKTFCEPGNKKTGILSLFKYIICEIYSEGVLVGEKEYTGYSKIEEEFVNGEIHPGTLKDACCGYIEKIVAPIRETMMKEEEILKDAY